MSEKKSANEKTDSLERSVIEIKSLTKENYKNILSMKDALEKFGLGIVDNLGKFKSEFDDLKNQLSKLDAFEITLRGLRFTTKETLEKMTERIFELEKIVKDTPKVDAIVVQEIEEKDTTLNKSPKIKIPRGTANETATENTFQTLMDYIKQQIPAAELTNRIAETRDTLMSWAPHHPAFYEMMDWIQKVKRFPKNEPIPAKEANQLLKDIEDWLSRMTKK